jgi:hypothetical protein
MSLDDISVIIGRLLIALVVVGALYLAVNAIAPGWLQNEINNALNSIQTIALGRGFHPLLTAAGRIFSPVSHPQGMASGRFLPRAA